MFNRRFVKVVALFQRDAVCTASRFLSIFEKVPQDFRARVKNSF